MPKVSVIIPIYNSEGYLNNLIKCIESQTYSDFEVIFVNDGSTDNSLEILQDYCKNSTNRVLINKKNGGVSSARNLGMQNARGDYFVFWDADDDISCDFLKEMTNHFEDGRLLFCGFKYCKDDLSVIKTYSKQEKISLDKNCIKALQDTWLFNVLWNKIFKREIIKRNHLQFDEQIAFGEDTLFVASYLNHVNGITVLNKPLYTYYTRPTNASSKYHSNMFSTNEKIYEAIILSMDESLPSYNQSILEIRKAYSFALIGALWHYCKFIKKENAKTLLKQSLKEYKNNKIKVTPKVNILLKLVLNLKWVWLARLYYKIFVKR